MDQVAALAEVSKLTIYQPFSDKSALFTAVVVSSVDEASDVVQQEILALGRTGDLAADLRALARHQLDLVMQPHLLRLRRLVIAELARFPELGRIFYAGGPGRTIVTLASILDNLAGDGVLRAEDPHLAATQFNWLLMAEPLNRAHADRHRRNPGHGRTRPLRRRCRADLPRRLPALTGDGSAPVRHR